MTPVVPPVPEPRLKPSTRVSPMPPVRSWQDELHQLKPETPDQRAHFFNFFYAYAFEAGYSRCGCGCGMQYNSRLPSSAEVRTRALHQLQDDKRWVSLEFYAICCLKNGIVPLGLVDMCAAALSADVGFLWSPPISPLSLAEDWE